MCHELKITIEQTDALAKLEEKTIPNLSEAVQKNVKNGRFEIRNQTDRLPGVVQLELKLKDVMHVFEGSMQARNGYKIVTIVNGYPFWPPLFNLDAS